MNQVANVAKTFFRNIWEMFIGTDLPGVGVSIAAVMIAFLIMRYSIRLFAYVSGFSMGSGYGRAADAAERIKNTKYQSKSTSLSTID